MQSLTDAPPLGSECMMAQLLPAGVACAEMEGDDPLASLFPAEIAQVEGAIDSRMREFATSRSCARRALRKFGLPEAAILRGPHREPLWPPGFVGSITHCEGYRAAAVARQSDLLTLGIDAEIHDELPSDVLESVCKGSEISWLAAAPKGVCWDRVMFSAKESIFKAWFPLVGKWLGFEDVALTVDPTTGTFHASLLVEPPLINGGILSGFSGRFSIRKEFIFTVTAVRCSDLTPMPRPLQAI